MGLDDRRVQISKQTVLTAGILRRLLTGFKYSYMHLAIKGHSCNSCQVEYTNTKALPSLKPCLQAG